jgi:hypothetical protein
MPHVKVPRHIGMASIKFVARTKVSVTCYTTEIGKVDNSSVSICLSLQF